MGRRLGQLRLRCGLVLVGGFILRQVRQNALHFSLSVASTTGFGDVHAVGRLARSVVPVQMAYNVGFVGVVLASVRRIVSAWTAPSAEPAPSRPDRLAQLDRRSRVGAPTHDPHEDHPPGRFHE
jgi:hypothetical protein